jgi:hypothetical protein
MNLNIVINANYNDDLIFFANCMYQTKVWNRNRNRLALFLFDITVLVIDRFECTRLFTSQQLRRNDQR